MAWRTLSREDLETRLSSSEIEAYAATVPNGDAIGALIEQTADEVRGFVASNRFAILSDVPHSLPAMLVGPCLDLVAFNLLKVVNLPANETRERASEDARALLEKIAEGKITPEPGKTVSPGASTVAAPSIAVKPPIL